MPQGQCAWVSGPLVSILCGADLDLKGYRLTREPKYGRKLKAGHGRPPLTRFRAEFRAMRNETDGRRAIPGGADRDGTSVV